MSKLKRLLIAVLLITLLPSGVVLWAQGLVPCGLTENDMCTICDFVVLFQNLLNLFVTKILWFIALGMILYAGFLIITSGDSKKKSGYDLIKKVLIGLVIILLAWVLINTFIYIVAPDYVDPMTGEKLQNSWNKINCNSYDNLTAPSINP